MFERFSNDARAVVVTAQNHARRLAHPATGAAHLLLALSAQDTPSARLLQDHAVTPAAVERELSVLLGRGNPASSRSATTSSPSPDEDAAALAALGIDLAAIRASVEAAFGPGALDRLDPGADSGRPGLLGRLSRRRPGTSRGGHLPFGPDARKALELTLREAIRLKSRTIETEHLVLGLLRGDNLAGDILTRLGVDQADLRRSLEAGLRRSA